MRQTPSHAVQHETFHKRACHRLALMNAARSQEQCQRVQHLCRRCAVQRLSVYLPCWLGHAIVDMATGPKTEFGGAAAAPAPQQPQQHQQPGPGPGPDVPPGAPGSNITAFPHELGLFIANLPPPSVPIGPAPDIDAVIDVRAAAHHLPEASVRASIVPFAHNRSNARGSCGFWKQALATNLGNARDEFCTRELEPLQRPTNDRCEACSLS